MQEQGGRSVYQECEKQASLPSGNQTDMSACSIVEHLELLCKIVYSRVRIDQLSMTCDISICVRVGHSKVIIESGEYKP